ncbi:phage tail fiber domain-containing protein [Brevundimonas phoenicis]|uniref:phage tail fiber domain-containing protein n=1 Tax=unclassified Brevundimonas TaxID=2622653 RepID=UPI0039A20CDA
MSYQTRVIYNVGERQREFDLAIPYLDKNHIKVALNGSAPFFEWVSDSRIRLTSPAVTNSILKISRVTPISAAAVEFQNGATLTKEELNRAVLQLLYRLQEQDDFLNDSLDRAMVRLGDHLGVVTTPDAIMDELLRVSELGDDLLNRFRDALASIDLNAETIISNTLSLSNQAFRMDNLTAVVDALANLEDGTGLATIIQNEAQARLDGDQALIDTLSLLGAKSGDNLSFILDLNKIRTSPTESLAQRFSALYAADANALSVIQNEQTARTNAIEAVTQTLNTQGSKIADNEAAIANEATTRATAISAEAQARQALSATIPGQINAAVMAETNARVAADQAEAQARQSLAVQVGNNSTAIQNEATARANADGAIAQQFAVLGAWRNGQSAFVLDLNRVEVGPGWTLGTRLSGIDTSIGNVSASVVDERTSRINGDNALSQTLQTVQNTVGGHTASITSLQQVTNGINARWTVALNSNGHITGITANNNGSWGTLSFVADEVGFVAPGGGTPVKVMSIVNGKVRFNSNVEIFGDLLVTGSITTPKLLENSVTRIDSVSMAGWRYGNNVKQNAITYTVDLPYAAKLICLATGTQSYTSNERAWHFDITVNGVAVTGVGGSGARTDSVSTSGYANLGPGQHTVTINWLGGDSTLRLVASNLIIMAVFK